MKKSNELTTDLSAVWNEEWRASSGVNPALLRHAQGTSSYTGLPVIFSPGKHECPAAGMLQSGSTNHPLLASTFTCATGGHLHHTGLTKTCREEDMMQKGTPSDPQCILMHPLPGCHLGQHLLLESGRQNWPERRGGQHAACWEPPLHLQGPGINTGLISAPLMSYESWLLSTNCQS